ncbi:glycosyltransferase family 4 protein [Arthrobacter sp. D1-29]
MLSLRLLVPANIRHHSGGNAYNARLVQGLRTLGARVEVLAVEGSWPAASAKERRRLGSLLGTWETSAETTSGTVTMVDGLIALGAPDELEYAAAARRPAWVLLHMPSAGHPESEARGLRAAAGVISTSSSTAAAIRSLHGLAESYVALPGTEPAPVAKGSDPPHIIVVAALLANKDQLLTVEALARLQDLAWTASFVGSDSADPEYAELVRAAIAARGLQDRVRITGQLTGEALEDEWNRADLSLLVSRAEAFGMVVTESLARGIPVIVREGTGAMEALTLAARAVGHTNGAGAALPDGALPGAAVGPPSSPDLQTLEPGTLTATNPEPLAAGLREWLEEPGLRAAWRAAALASRERLPGWEATARTVLEIVAAPRED